MLRLRPLSAAFAQHDDMKHDVESSRPVLTLPLMLILASASPRRAELLRNAGIEFRVDPAHIVEERGPGEAALDFARRLAREKARAVAARHSGNFVLGADTIVCVDNHVLGKPADAADAFAMLRLLSGRWHEVTTGICLIAPEVSAAGSGSADRPEQVAHETTRVQFSALNDDDIRAYIASGEPMDKAGAYAIQGMASRWITRIEGDYGNVVGLPVALLWKILRELTQ